MKENIQKNKILYIVESFAGGVYQVVKNLANNFINEYEIVIVYGKRKLTPKDFYKDFNDNVKFIEIKDFSKEINIKKDIKSIIEISNIIKQEKPDIIHLHSSKAGALGRLIKTNNIKTFYSPHGFSFLKKDVSKFKRKMYWMFEKILSIINKKCQIIACSKGEYIEALKLNKKSIEIDNCIDIKYIEKIKENKEKVVDWNNINICTIGRIDYSKNPEQFNKIAECFPNIEFKWIGDGDEKLKDKLTSSNITITGWLSEENVIKELTKEDIFILTSLWEGLPLSLLEAMCCKKNCIVSDVIGNRDVITNGYNGYIAHSTDEFVKKLKLIIEQKDMSVVNKSYKDVVEKYNINIMLNKYKKIYEEK